MARRSLSDPRSLAGASPDEIRALKPEGWLRRPLPPGRAGFRLLEPGKMPGARRRASMLPGGCGYRTFPVRPQPRLFILNAAAEQPLLAEILGGWARGGGRDPAESLDSIPLLAGAARRLLAGHQVSAWRDPLHGDKLLPLGGGQAEAAITGPLNWWRDEDDPAVPPATSLIVLDITAPGQQALAAASIWIPYHGGSETGTTGTENGTIVRDEELPHTARITLEEGGITAPWPVTCGVHGLGAHTSFHASRAEADAAFAAIKRRLESIAAAPDQETAVSRFRDLAHDF